MEHIDAKVLNAFFDEVVDIRKITEGMINQTYCAVTNAGDFLLQKINTQIFRDVKALQRNYEKISNELLQQKSFVLPAVISTKSGSAFYSDDSEYWRCFEFYADTYSPSSIENINQTKILAEAFANFSTALSGLKELDVIIPHFHDVDFRMKEYETALKNASPERMQRAEDLVKAVARSLEVPALFLHFQNNPDVFRSHILHHDCKISNILFSRKDNRVVCPVDIDTTMPGYFFSDLGDMIRSLGSNMKEDDPDFSEMHLLTDRINALIDTYTNVVKQHFTAEEVRFLSYSGHMLSYMQCVRFLTDFLNGDQYYSVKYPMHNLIRAQNQWQLYSLLNKKMPLSAVNF